MSLIGAHSLAALLGEPSGVGPAYADLADRIRAVLVDGRVPDGTRLPSERELADVVGVSRTTTTRAYAQLREQGLLNSRRGSGSVVSVGWDRSAVSTLIEAPGSDDLSWTYASSPAPAGLPAAFERAIAKLPALLRTTGYLPDGLPILRELLAQRYTDQGLPTSPNQILVTSGAIGALSMVGRALLKPGSRAVVEGLSYPHAYDALTASGARLSPLVVADHPWDPNSLASVLASRSHTLAYLIPDFHNPTGLVMDAELRARWATLLRRAEVVPVVDETLRPVNLDAVELPPSFATFDARAIVLGSASKEFWGGLRIGWARVPQRRVVRLVQSRMSLDLGSSAFEQLVLAELLDGPDLLPQRLVEARSAREQLIALLADRLPQLRPNRPAGGLSLWLELPTRISPALTAEAARCRLMLTPGSRFYAAAGGDNRLRLPFTLAPADLAEAVDRLAKAYDGIDSPQARDREAQQINLIA